jgi:hypothetical protein
VEPFHSPLLMLFPVLCAEAARWGRLGIACRTVVKSFSENKSMPMICFVGSNVYYLVLDKQRTGAGARGKVFEPKNIPPAHAMLSKAVSWLGSQLRFSPEPRHGL